jgi:DNA-binding response OmpR family regulator
MHARRAVADLQQKLKILLVYDQPAKLLSYELILEKLGEELIKANSGREALEQLLSNDVALILVDVSIPDINGFELAKMIREHPRFARIAIIFASASHLTEMDTIRGHQAGAVDYVPVPLIPDLLRAKVRVFADLYRKTRELELLNGQLEQRVAERTADLKRANADLERRVEERTRERQAAMSQLTEMQKQETLGQLTGGVAHDFNNLLMVLVGNLDLLRRKVPHDQANLRLIDAALEATERGVILTRRMLAVARRQDLKPESVDLSGLGEGMMDMVRQSLGPSIEMIWDVPRDLPLVRVNRNQLELALLTHQSII